MSKPLLQGTGLKKSYPGPGRVEVLKGVNLEVATSELVGIVGPSGSGKSTLLHLLGGLDAPSDGEVHFQGDSLYGMSDTAISRVRNQKFGFVFQFYHLVPELTALENVMLPAWMIGFDRPKPEVKKEATELLAAVGLSDRLEHAPSQLSGGEQQRVAVARALINRPQLVFCDEPTGNLDAEAGGSILKLLIKLNREQGTAFVIVTHEPSVTEITQRVLSLKDGQLWA